MSLHLAVKEVSDIVTSESSESELSAPDKSIRSKSEEEEEEEEEENLIEKKIAFEMTFRDTGCGITPEN